MKRKILKICLIFSLLLLYHCGFKAIDKSNINDFSIETIKISGNKRINFKIKNNLIINSKKNSASLLNIDIETKKTKQVKEKNIKNEITKYQISITCNVSFKLSNNNERIIFNVNADGDYLVGNNYSKTLNNEKKLIDDLVQNISEQIINELNFKLNDI